MIQTLVSPARTRPPLPVLDERPHELDSNLPAWARRSDPIVKRHLGLYWKTMALEPALYARAWLAQIGFILLSWPIPALFTIIMPAVTVSLIALPAALYLHGFALFHIATHVATWTADERRNDTLDLLRVLPRPMLETVYSKMAAALWREAENYSLILYAAVLCSLPLIVIQTDVYFDVATYPLGMRLGAITALTVSLVRPVLEAIMVASLGALCGAFTRFRLPASSSAILLAGAYFVAINAVRLPTWPPEIRTLVEYGLPLVLPAAISLLCTRAAAGLLKRDG